MIPENIAMYHLRRTLKRILLRWSLQQVTVPYETYRVQALLLGLEWAPAGSLAPLSRTRRSAALLRIGVGAVATRRRCSRPFCLSIRRVGRKPWTSQVKLRERLRKSRSCVARQLVTIFWRHVFKSIRAPVPNWSSFMLRSLRSTNSAL